MIKIDKLKKNYGKLEVLKGISTEIGQGEVLAIIGPFRFRKINFLALYQYA